MDNMTGPTISTYIQGNNDRGIQAGNFNGSVYYNLHASLQDRPKSPLGSPFVIPFRRDPDFVGCEKLLSQIKTRCSTQASRVALVGFGGVGKSQLAIEHCYDTAKTSPDTWVFWVHASNKSRLEQGFRDIADRLKLEGRDSPSADMFKLVHNWLREEKNGKWLLVLDNLDDPEIPRHLTSYLPASRNGSVLVTSRTMRAAICLVDDDDIIPIEPMDSASAQALLQKKLGSEADKDGIKELAAALENMPIALAHAGTYIRQRRPFASVRQYLEVFRKNDREKNTLLDHEDGRLRRDMEAKNSVILTWHISFDHIRQIQPSAADLLSLMSFFDRQGIPHSLLDIERGAEPELEPEPEPGEPQPQPQQNPTRPQKRLKHSHDKSEHPSNWRGDGDGNNDYNCDNNVDKQPKFTFEDDILTLQNYSFVAVGADKATFEMHALVQLATRRWLKDQGGDELAKWRQQYLGNLDAALPNGKFENWTVCQLLFPHAISAEAQKPTPSDKHSLLLWSNVLHKAGEYALEMGKYNDAERMLVKAVEASTDTMGPKHLITLNVEGALALVYFEQGRWAEAEKLRLRIRDEATTQFGNSHTVILYGISRLASTYLAQNRLDEAEKLYVQVLEMRKSIFGHDHPDTITSMNNLASTYLHQGRYDQAEKLQVQVIELQNSKLGPRHIDTIWSTSALALTFYEQKKYEKAKNIQLKVLEMLGSELNLERGHPNIIQAVHSLASTYSAQSRFHEAEKLYAQALESQKMVLGNDHLDTLFSMNFLAYTRKNLGRTVEAIELMRESVERSHNVLGVNHEFYLQSKFSLEEWEAEANLEANLEVVPSEVEEDARD